MGRNEMVTDTQVRRLKKLSKTEKTQNLAAAKAGMDIKTARKHLLDGRLPSEQKQDRTWRTRPDPFDAVWDEIRQQIDANPGLEAKTIFEALQRENPGKYADGQLRTLQRRIKRWRATEGPGREVFFAQQHVPGRLGESDFTHMTPLGITIGGQSFPHLFYHFVLGVLELGGRHVVLLREFREPEQRNGECPLGTRRRSRATPDRPALHSREQHERRQGVHPAL